MSDVGDCIVLLSDGVCETVRFVECGVAWEYVVWKRG